MSDSRGGVSTRRVPMRDDAQPEVRRGCASSTLGKLRGCVHTGLRDVRVGDSLEGRTKMKAAKRRLPGNHRATPNPPQSHPDGYSPPGVVGTISSPSPFEECATCTAIQSNLKYELQGGTDGESLLWFYLRSQRFLSFMSCVLANFFSEKKSTLKANQHPWAHIASCR